MHAAANGPAVSPGRADSVQLGDEVQVVRDALLEIQAPRRNGRTWCFIQRGTRARLVARHDGIDRLVLADGPYARDVAFASAPLIARAAPRG